MKSRNTSANNKLIHLAIVTINYNGLADTIDLLESIRKAKKSKNISLQVYVVDNASKDDSVNVLPQKYPEIRFISSSENLGFAAGNNLGIKQALREKADWIMLINNDTFVDKNLFSQLAKSVLNQPTVGVLGGLIYFAPGFEFQNKYKKNQLGKVIWFGGGLIDWDNIYASHKYVDQVDTGQITQPQPTDFVTGAFLISRRNILKKIKLFDEKYFMYLEDVELCQRIKQAGYQIIIDPKLKIWHKVAQSSAIGSPLNDYFITRNRLIFGSKYASWRTKQALWREAFKKLFTGTPAQKQAVKDFFLHHWGKGNYAKIQSSTN